MSTPSLPEELRHCTYQQCKINKIFIHLHIADGVNTYAYIKYEHFKSKFLL